MKKELVGIIVCVLMIISVLPASGNNLEKTSYDIPGIGIVIKSGSHETILGCQGLVYNNGEDNVTLNVSFIVISYSLQRDYLGESSHKFEITFTPDMQANPHIIPDYYGETFTWVHAKLDVKNVENIEQTESDFRIGLSIGRLIFFSNVLTWIYYIIDVLT